MYKIKNHLLTSALILLSFIVEAQNIFTYSPYSRYGLGLIPTKGFANTKGMGGISQAYRNPFQINYLNPASYTAQDTMSFILDFGIEVGGTNYKTSSQSATDGTGGIHHVAISFPITKWWGASLGIVPFSNVGYKIKFYENDPLILSSIGRVKYYHSGSGGINQAYVGNAFKPIKDLSLGVNFSYLFGSLNYYNETVFPSSQSGYSGSSTNSSIVVSDINFSFGAQYTAYLDRKEKTYFIFGATIENKTKLSGKYKYLAESQMYNYTDTISFIDGNTRYIDYPRNLSLGTSFNYKDKLFTAIEYSTQDWSKSLILGAKDSLTKSQAFRFGLEYTPNRSDLKSYLKRMSYRVGGHYEDTYLIFNNHQIKDIGLSVGISFPFRNNTKFNVSFEYGKRGTTSNSLIQETYGLVNFSFSFYDFWFYKRKYN